MAETLPSIDSTGGQAFWFEGHNGNRLRGAAWDIASGEPSGTVLLLNGRTEFIEKTLEPIGELTARGFAVRSLDWRGQGLSARALKNRHKGHIDDFDTFLKDLSIFLETRVLPELKPPLLMVAHSMGGHIGLRCLQDRPADFAGALFSSPMVDIAADGFKGVLRNPTGWLGGFGWFAKRYLPMTGDYGPDDKVFEGNVLTSDRARFDQFHAQIARNPDLALGGATMGWLNAALKSVEVLNKPANARKITTPVIIASAGDEKIVSNPAQAELVALLPNGRLETIPGARHELMIEADSHRNRFWELFDRLRGDVGA